MANLDVENFMAKLEQLMSSDIDFIVKQKKRLRSLHKKLGFLREFLRRLFLRVSEENKQEEHPEGNQKERLRSLHKKLGFLREFLRDSEDKQEEHPPEVKKLATQIRDVMFKAENAIDLFAMKKGVLRLEEVDKDIKFLTKEMKEIHENTDVKTVSRSSSSGGSSRQSIPKTDVKTEVGLDDEARRIIEQLGGNIGRKRGQLKFIPIVGSPGAGKTTLAMKVFNDRFSEERFNIRGCITVSQVHNKRQMLIGILKSTSIVKEGFERMDDDELGEVLLRGLRDKRYLIVMDDIWSMQAWNDIQRSFTGGCVAGSTIIFTTRLTEVANGVSQDPPHRLHPLSKVHSWELLQIKVFGKKDCCPLDLVEIGMEISEKCRGLPLAIVAVAGILIKTNRTPESWKEVATSLSSIIARNQEEVYMDTLALSYNHLPLRLKACFLYFGLFPEDYEIKVRKLTWLWVAEGFVKQCGDKSLEVVAEDYFTDLVDRNLVTPTKKSSNGTRIKACRIHDLLRELCLRKAEEDNFLRYVDEVGKIRSSLFFSSSSKHRRLGLNSRILDYDDLRTCAPNVRSLLCYYVVNDLDREPKVVPHFAVGLELLRILGLQNYYNLHPLQNYYNLHSLCSLVHLTYLEVELDYGTIPPSISNLRNLQTLSIHGKYWNGVFNLPHEMCNMVNLRHLYIREGYGAFHFEGKSHSDGPILGNLQTLYPLCACKGCQTFLTRTPNLKKLGLEGGLVTESGDLLFPEVEFLEHLETLAYFNAINPISFLGLKFPTAVKKLTLDVLGLRWNEISVVLGTLPNLEVLKLRSRASTDEPVWDTSELGEEGCFSKLKCLKLESWSLEEWNASFEDFQSLEILDMKFCTTLEAIPSAFSELPLLHTIDLRVCTKTAEDSARKIKEDRFQNTGDDSLRLRIIEHG